MPAWQNQARAHYLAGRSGEAVHAALAHGPGHGPLHRVKAQVEEQAPDPGDNHVVPVPRGAHPGQDTISACPPHHSVWVAICILNASPGRQSQRQERMRLSAGQGAIPHTTNAHHKGPLTGFMPKIWLISTWNMK